MLNSLTLGIREVIAGLVIYRTYISEPGRGVALILLLSTMMIPSQVTMVPSFLVWRRLGWYDTLNPLWNELFPAEQARIVELKFFGGLSIEETAEVLSIGHATVERDWKMARAWLRNKLS